MASGHPKGGPWRRPALCVRAGLHSCRKRAGARPRTRRFAPPGRPVHRHRRARVPC